jgi:valyl-tRNA synthetase
MLEKTYKPSEIEGRIYRQWEDSGAFRAGSKTGKAADPFCIVIPPPNVTGSLHMGHALNNTLQDVLIRFERMRGKDVLWQPGTDHAGIATQSVVERQLMERQEPDRRAMGRETFVERVWKWKEQSGGTIIGQLKRLGASCDWSRERFTMDEGLSQAVLKVFIELYRKGLIYKDKRLVNWDTKLLTAISDLEVESVETNGHLWYFRYPIKNPGRLKHKHIVVATTRPETMLGDTAVAVHPDDKRWKKYIGKMVELPLVGREIPIIADEYADPEQGSGAVKITPAHDFNDFEVGKRHDLPQINIFDQHGALNENAPEAYRGLDRFEARKRVVADLEALGLVEKIEPHTLKVPYGDRSGTVIEPWLTDQWYVDAGKLAEQAIKAVETGRTVFVPRNWEKTYFEWMRNIQPWCISRQLWWGHQIPAWYGLEPAGTGVALSQKDIFVASTPEEAAEQARTHYGRDVVILSDEREIFDWIERIRSGGRLEQYPIIRDPDVLDTWFSSALWPFSTLGWPEQTPELKRYYPTSVLVTGFDIIFFWVARMMMMGLEFMNEVPFHTVYIHALVRDEKGQKMSKSKGNVMDPLDIIDGIELEALIEKRTAALDKPEDRKRVERDTRKDYPNGIESYGADALRFFLAAMAAQGRDVKLSIDRVAGYRNFATKLWNAARFGEMNGCAPKTDFDPAKTKATINRWIGGEMQRTVAAVTQGIEEHRFNDAANAVYHFVWHTFCDWYLELAKPILGGSDAKAKVETQAMVAWTLDRILILLHPFMPFITEELWERIGEAGAGRNTMLITADWPQLTGLADAEADAEIAWAIDLVSEVRSVRSEMNVPPAVKIPLIICGAPELIEMRVERHGETLQRLARLASIAFESAPPKGAVQIVMKDAVLALPLADVVDLAAERERLKREIEKVKSDIEKLDEKLGDEKFTSRAPEHVVEENRERRAQASEAEKRLHEALKRLEAAA